MSTHNGMNNHRSNSDTAGHRAKAFPGGDEYRTKVAIPVMDAVDRMPETYRDCCNDFGYVEVYLAWRRGWSVQQIRKNALDNGGRCVL